jgi:hypothetical protein
VNGGRFTDPAGVAYEPACRETGKHHQWYVVRVETDGTRIPFVGAHNRAQAHAYARALAAVALDRAAVAAQEWPREEADHA